jgi:chemotaxis-related protein WspD
VGLVGIDDCWNRIGVWGAVRPRCERLEEYTHCRHCPVYLEAAVRLRDRPVAADYAVNWREHYAQPLPVRVALHDGQPVLAFRLGAERLALTLDCIEEVIDPVAVYRLVRDGAEPIQGLASVHGRLRPCMDLALLLGIETAIAAQGGRYPRMVVMKQQTSQFVFRVDEVLGISRFLPADLQAPPATLAHVLRRFSLGLIRQGETTVGLLNGAHLFEVLRGTARP